MTLPVGTILGHRYELRAFIGSDGMLDVYRGLDLRLGRDVALTVLEILAIHTPEELINFEKEAQIRANLHHPRIMTVHDFGHGTGCAFQVAEWLEGQSLRKRQQRGPITWKEAQEIGEAVIEGLGVLLRKGFTLRILDATAIFLEHDGKARLFAYQLRRIEGGDILKAQKEGLQALAMTLLVALGDSRETAAERALPLLRSWAGRTELDASALRREFENLLQRPQASPAGHPAKRRWMTRTALLLVVPVGIALYLQRGGLPAPPAPPSPAPRGPVDPEARRLRLQGAALLETGEPEDLRKALVCLQSAITREPLSAEAYGSLGRAYCLLGMQRLISREEAQLQSRTAIEHALKLDPAAGTVHAALAFQKTWYELDGPGAEQEYRRALELAPDRSDILRDYGALLAFQGRWDECLAQCQAALERDPLSRSARLEAAVFLHWAGREDEALDQFAKVLDQAPGAESSWSAYQEVTEQLGRYDEALRAADRLAALGALPERDAIALRTAYEARGEKGYWQARVQQAESLADPLALAELVAQQGDRERAFRLLARGLRERNLRAVRVGFTPALASLRADPRFKQLLAQTGSPKS